MIAYINDRVQNKNKNFGMCFVGPTGSGKSLAALKLAEKIDPTFDHTRVAFRAREFMQIVNYLTEEGKQGADIKGKVIIWDEVGIENNSRAFMSKANRLINFFFQTSRHYNLVMIFTVPYLSFIDSSTRKLLHAIAEMDSINFSENSSTAKVKFIQVNNYTGKIYPKYLRYNQGGMQRVMRKISFKLPKDEIRFPYEDKKQQFTTDLNKRITEGLMEEDKKPQKKEYERKLTERQKEVSTFLSEHSVGEAAEHFDITLGSVYSTLKAIEKKDYEIRPIRKGDKVVSYEIKKQE